MVYIRNIVFMLVLTLVGGVAIHYVRQQMFTLTNDLVATTKDSLHKQGCEDLGTVKVKTSSVSVDLIGPGPFTTREKSNTLLRFKCEDGTLTDLPIN